MAFKRISFLKNDENIIIADDIKRFLNQNDMNIEIDRIVKYLFQSRIKNPEGLNF